MKKAHSVSPTHPAPVSEANAGHVGRTSIPANGGQPHPTGTHASVPANAADTSETANHETGETASRAAAVGPAVDAYPDVVG